MGTRQGAKSGRMLKNAASLEALNDEQETLLTSAFHVHRSEFAQCGLAGRHFCASCGRVFLLWHTCGHSSCRLTVV
jgi:hypothetical protein